MRTMLTCAQCKSVVVFDPRPMLAEDEPSPREPPPHPAHGWIELRPIAPSLLSASCEHLCKKCVEELLPADVRALLRRPWRQACELGELVEI